MNQGFQFIDLIFFGVIAAFVLLRLRSVLGTRTGHEKRPEDLAQRRQGGVAGDRADQVLVSLPQRRTADSGADAASPELAQRLMEIKLADQSFDAASFISGARQAYEIIVTAFARGDRDVLRGMLGDEVFANFNAAIIARESAGQTMQTRLNGIREARIAEASLQDGVAELSVKFIADLVSSTLSADGAVLAGHPSLAQEAAELWSFSRDTRSADPNWTLVATAPA